MFKLVIQDDEGKTTVVPLVRDEITIGRKEGNTIRLTERNVSRRHARIVRNNGEVTIEDLGSYNGIRVNNARIAERVQLRVSDQVQIGDYKLFLKAEGLEHVDDAKTVPIERIETATTVDAVAAIDNVPLATPPPGAVPPVAPSSGPPQMVGNPNRTLVAIADTDPAGRPIASAAVVASLNAPVGHARLVVLSSNFAGSEFELSRPQMIIGRTDENDIVINHRSISRNHAKLVREPDTGRYTVSDLQSSNGVRVNGQDYGKVELRRGDVIDLGHVRMRFVEAGEEYVFTRDAIEDVPEEGKGRGLWVAIAVAALLLGGIGLYFAFGRGGTGGGTPDATKDAGIAVVEPVVDAAPPVDTQVAVEDAAATPPPVDAAMIPTPPKPDAGVVAVADDVVKRKRAECAQLQGEERWVELKKCAGELLRAKGTTGDDVTAANDFARQAGIEVTAKMQLEKFLTAQKGDDMRGMAAIARSFNKQSMYAQQVQEKWESEKSKYVSSKMSAARSAAKNGKCGELRGFANSVRPYDSRSADEISGLSCAGATTTAAVDCNDPAVAAAATSLYDEIQAARISDQKNTIRLTEQALANKCLANRRAALLRIGLYAACSEGRADKVEFFFAKANRDPTLISTCPALLGDGTK